MSVTKAAQYNLRPPATSGRSYSYKVQAQHGVAKINGDRSKVVEFHIPCSANTFLDQSQSYLQFKVRARSDVDLAANQVIALDGTVASLIHRLEIYHGSNLLETIDNYNVLHTLLTDLTVDNTTRGGVMGALMGSDETPTGTFGNPGSFTPGTPGSAVTVLNTATEPAATDVASSAGLISVNTAVTEIADYLTNNVVDKTVSSNFRKGVTVSNSGDDADVGFDQSNAAAFTTFCLPIALSALLSPASKKYLPLFAMQADSLRLQLTLEDPAKALVCGTKKSAAVSKLEYEIADMHYACQFVELTSEVCGAILQDGMANGGGALRISSESYRGFETTQLEQDTAFSFQVPARFSSVNSLYSCWRPSQVQNLSKRSLTGRVQPKGLKYQYRIGSNLVPSQRVDTPEQSLIEVLKTFNAVSSANFQTSVTKTNWNQVADDIVTGTTNESKDQGSFCIGLETSLFANANDIVDSGKQTISEVVQLEGEHKGIKGGALVNTWARYDMAVIISDGLATTVF